MYINTLNVKFNNIITRLEEINKNSNNNNSNTINADLIISEINDRNKRLMNIIFYNVNEHTNIADSIKIKEILNSIGLNYTEETFFLKRLGRITDNKKRPILVGLKTKDDVIFVLKNQNKLPQGIHVSENRTTLQRDNYKNIKEKVLKNNRDNPNNLQTIKYINGAPTIIPKKSNQNDQKN